MANSNAELCKTRWFETSAGQICTRWGAGSRANIVLLHGNSSCKEVFASVAEHLARDGHNILVPDLPGHGESSDARDPEGTYTFPGYAAVITELLDALEWDRFVVVGWSLGGHIAMELVHMRPGCTGLMIVGSPPGKPCQEALSQAFFTTETTLLAGKETFSEADAVRYVAAMLGTTPVDPFFLAKAMRTDGRARRIMFTSALAGVGIDQTIVAASATRPLAIVHGENEPFVRLDYLEGLEYGWLWDNAVNVIREAGHAPHVEQAEAFNRLLTRFLTATGAT